MSGKQKLSFENSINKVSAFKDGAAFYYDRQDYAHATFMLHQVIELTLTAVEVLFLRKRIRNHCIKIHLKQIKEQIPNVKITFPANTDEERLVLHLLDKAYIAVRYKDLYAIEKGQVDVILGWINGLDRSIGAAFNEPPN